MVLLPPEEERGVQVATDEPDGGECRPPWSLR